MYEQNAGVIVTDIYELRGMEQLNSFQLQPGNLIGISVILETIKLKAKAAFSQLHFCNNNSIEASCYGLRQQTLSVTEQSVIDNLVKQFLTSQEALILPSELKPNKPSLFDLGTLFSSLFAVPLQLFDNSALVIVLAFEIGEEPADINKLICEADFSSEIIELYNLISVKYSEDLIATDHQKNWCFETAKMIYPKFGKSPLEKSFLDPLLQRDRLQSLTLQFSLSLGDIIYLEDLISRYRLVIADVIDPSFFDVLRIDAEIYSRIPEDIAALLIDANFTDELSKLEKSSIEEDYNELLTKFLKPITGDEGPLLVHTFYCMNQLNGILWIKKAALDDQTKIFYDTISALFVSFSKWLIDNPDSKDNRTDPFDMGMIADSPEIKEVLMAVKQVSATDSTVLITGETGTGKELIANCIHKNSRRHAQPLIKINCATLPANLIESELFGHERGSFTGATERRIGKFESANRGTLFLDEIAEMPMELQARLLRALQEREIERIGGAETIKIDVRIMAATNKNLLKEVESGNFRSDLFYRLNIFPIEIPPLRKRLADIKPLAKHFACHFAEKFKKSTPILHSSVIKELEDYHWPGNIRELEHLIERTILINNLGVIKGNIMSESLKLKKNPAGEKAIKTIDENERMHILSVLDICHGRVGGKRGAAIKLGVPPTTLYSKIKKLGIQKGFNF